MKTKELEKLGFSPKIIAIVNGEKMENLTLGEIFCLKEILPKKRLPELWEASKETAPFDILLLILDKGNFSRKYYKELMVKATNTSERLELINYLPEYYAEEIIEKIVNIEECIEAMYDIDAIEDPRLSDLLLKKAASFSPSIDTWTELRQEATEYRTKAFILKEMQEIALEEMKKEQKTNNLLSWLKLYSLSLDGTPTYLQSKFAIEKINPTIEEWTEALLAEDQNDLYKDRWYRAYVLGMKLMEKQSDSFDFWFELDSYLFDAIKRRIKEIKNKFPKNPPKSIIFWEKIIEDNNRQENLRRTAKTLEEKIFVYDRCNNKELVFLKEISEM